MTDLISRQALRETMYHEAFETDSDMQRWDSGCWIRYKMFENAIESAPSIDPVKHGEWIHTGGKFSRNKTVDRRILTCSICGNTLSMEGVNAGRGDANYCPNCGADMRGDDDV